MKFNLFNKQKNETTNYMGAKAYRLTPELELYTAVVTSLLSDTYYEKPDERLTRIQDLIRKNDPQFVAKLAVYAREKMYLRSLPLVLVTELAKIHQGDNLVSRATNRVVQRADEITELLAYYQLANARKDTKKLNRLSKQIQKGLADAFNKFDEYQFSKYNRTGTDVKLRDALFLIHPKAKNETQQVIFNKIASDTLTTAQTWETTLSAVGQGDFDSENEKLEAKSQAWETLILSGKLGYMALLRNLRNILEANVSQEALNKVCVMLSDARAVANSKQFPFRFLSAYRELEKLKKTGIFEKENAKVNQVLMAIENAVIHSVQNLPMIEGKTLILTDNSGSMRGDLGGASLASVMSKRTTADIANLFAVLYWTRCENTMLGLFGDNLITPELRRSFNVFENFKIISKEAQKCGLSTEAGIFKAIENLIDTKSIVDRIVIFSDCQIGAGCNWYDRKGRRADSFQALFNVYRKINPNVKTFSIDLRGYGNTMMNNNIYTIAGWSDKIFDVMSSVEKGDDAVKVINRVEL
jgi:60 kDa SS-A/Ro ribonucleoprotein